MAALFGNAPRTFYPRNDPYLMLSDKDFQRGYRFSKAGFDWIYNLVADDLPLRTTARNHALSRREILEIGLKFFGTGNYQGDIGETHRVHQPIVSECITACIDAFANRYDQFVQMPQTPEEVTEVKLRFQQYGHTAQHPGIPNCLGAIDGTQIPIEKPCLTEAPDPASFFCRKSKFRENFYSYFYFLFPYFY